VQGWRYINCGSPDGNFITFGDIPEIISLTATPHVLLVVDARRPDEAQN